MYLKFDYKDFYIALGYKSDVVTKYFKNFKKFNKKFLKKYNEKPNEVSILAYDALGLIYYCWANNNFQFKKNQSVLVTQ